MRTTLTLDPDVAAGLEALMETRESSFKAVVNEVLRRGLEVGAGANTPPPRYQMTVHRAGRCYLPSLDSVHDVLTRAEGENYR